MFQAVVFGACRIGVAAFCREKSAPSRVSQVETDWGNQNALRPTKPLKIVMNTIFMSNQNDQL
ncbi:hypothetical protein B0G80_0322 [Paraburkholderia sp. BL6669N2]|nr:hypothetical protein B0G80_0322 [Paraburkholderia sp. BL6669N2]